MIYTHVLAQGPLGVRSPADRLGPVAHTEVARTRPDRNPARPGAHRHPTAASLRPPTLQGDVPSRHRACPITPSRGGQPGRPLRRPTAPRPSLLPESLPRSVSRQPSEPAGAVPPP